LPDLVIADKGSNQVSILLNTSQNGNISFRLGPRLNAGGVGPVSTVVGNFTGSAYPDLLVTNSGSNDVALLPGVGQGFFSDTSTKTFPVGVDPVTGIVGNFNGNTDLLTVNAGANDLTLISGFEGANPVATTLPSGGVDPDTAFAFATTSGLDDLVVGNNGDGTITLIQFSNGVAVEASLTDPSLPAPTSLVFASLTNNELGFYAATAGVGSASLLSFSFADGTVIPGFPSIATLETSVTGGSAFSMRFPSDGPDPVPSFTIQISGEGQASLQIVGVGDGLVGLQIGTENVDFETTLSTSYLSAPVTNALAGFIGDEVQFSATTGSLDAFSLLSLILGTSAPVISSSAHEISAAAPGLLPLNESSLSLVGSLLTLTIPTNTEQINLVASANETTTAAVFGTGQGPTAGQSLTRQDSIASTQGNEALGRSDGDSAKSQEGAPGASHQAPSVWRQYLLGIDEALEHFRLKTPADPPKGAAPVIGPSAWFVPWRAGSAGPKMTMSQAVDEALRTLCGDQGGPGCSAYFVPRLSARPAPEKPGPTDLAGVDLPVADPGRQKARSLPTRSQRAREGLIHVSLLTVLAAGLLISSTRPGDARKAGPLKGRGHKRRQH
jgi:hypothetical protein